MHVVLQGDVVAIRHRVVDLAEQDVVVAFARIEDAEPVVERERCVAARHRARRGEERALGRAHEVREIPSLLVEVDEVEHLVGAQRPAGADAVLLTALVGLDLG